MIPLRIAASHALAQPVPVQDQSGSREHAIEGSPAAETLQVDESINSLGEQVEYHIETVRALLRRLCIP
jgi:hypothetical protein